MTSLKKNIYIYRLFPRFFSQAYPQSGCDEMWFPFFFGTDETVGVLL